jgi:hypothetical protein
MPKNPPLSDPLHFVLGTHGWRISLAQANETRRRLAEAHVWAAERIELKASRIRTAQYGLKAMVHLAGSSLAPFAQAADIAEANSISKKFLDHILTDLRRAGLVYSRKGRGGGYRRAGRRPTSGSGRSCALSTGRSRRSAAPPSPRFGRAAIAPTWRPGPSGWS